MLALDFLDPTSGARLDGLNAPARNGRLFLSMIWPVLERDALRNAFEVKQMRFQFVWLRRCSLTILSASQALGCHATVRDGGTLQLGNVTYRLDGIDAPPFDQTLHRRARR